MCCCMSTSVCLKNEAKPTDTKQMSACRGAEDRQSCSARPGHGMQTSTRVSLWWIFISESSDYETPAPVQ